MRITNPAFNVFSRAFGVRYGESTMTVQGAVNKFGILLITMLGAGFFSWWALLQNYTAITSLARLIGLFGGLILGFVTISKPSWASKTAPFYAVCQGLFLGGFSAIFEAAFPGITLVIMSLTFSVASIVLLAYQFNLVRASENFRLIVLCATGTLAFVYIIALVLSLFGIKMPLIFDSGILGIIFSLIVVGIAAANLILDFDLIEQGQAQGLPKYMEWFAAFSVLVTLIWLYMEIFKLALKLLRKR